MCPIAVVLAHFPFPQLMITTWLMHSINLSLPSCTLIAFSPDSVRNTFWQTTHTSSLNLSAIANCCNNAFTAIFGNISTAHAQKRLSMNFRCKFRHRRSIPRPRFPTRVENFGDSGTFSVDFCILYLNVRHISTSGLFDLLI